MAAQTNFIDIATIWLHAGKGGDGAVSFHREKFVAAGGPDGGDGGRGGDIIFVVDDPLTTLMDFRYKRKYTADEGGKGGASLCHGKNAENLVIKVPLGTVIKDAESGLVIADLSDHTPVTIAKGGRGGYGNAHFATPTRQIPKFAKPGMPGEDIQVTLELKLIADVGLIGFPNVGKSTLISTISAAKPKIANYHFTTLVPTLGVVSVGEGASFVCADIPGLIEGASEGVGLGHDFLRHVERCRLLLHVVDVSGSECRDPIEDFEQINEELAKFSPALAERPQIVVGNKCDLATEEQIDTFRKYVEEKGLTYDKEGFEKAQKEQRAKSEGTFGTHSYTGKDATVYDELDAELATEFVGYENLVCDAKVTALTSEEEIVDALSDGEKGTIIVDKTTFYGTMGGQEGDIGTIKTADGEFVVENTIHLAGTKIGHVGYVSHGMIKVGDTVSMEVDKENRNLSARNHSATHLLQAALRQVLGTHVEQAGSYVDAERLRFDFTHFSALSKEELKQVENIVNEKIAECLPVVAKNMPIEEARKTGAAALFGEKYGDVVRVVSMGDFSVEFCGGTHVSNTGVISALKIISETGVAAGVRRIEALTSKGLLKYYDDMEKKLQEAAALVKATPNQLSDKIRHLQAENKELHSELESVKSKMAKEAMGDVSDQVTEVKGVKLIAAKVDDVDMNGLRDLGDQLKEKLGEGVIVLASAAAGKVSLVAMATDEAVKKGAHAGNLIKGIAGLVGGGGGGRPNMAQAGGKNPDGIDAAIAKVSEVLESQL